jgi:hypothetical protein
MVSGYRIAQDLTALRTRTRVSDSRIAQKTENRDRSDPLAGAQFMVGPSPKSIVRWQSPGHRCINSFELEGNRLASDSRGAKFREGA